MHAPLLIPSESTHHLTWRNGVNGQHYFNSDYARKLIEHFNATGDAETLNRFLEHAEPLAKSILEYRCTTKYENVDELLSRIRIKLWRSLKLYNSQKGTAFSFVARVISSTSASIVGEVWARNERFCSFDESSDSAVLCDPVASSEAVSDIQAQVRRVKTPCTELAELKAQRWLVDSFIDCEFHIRRHEAADSAMKVYGLDYVRSRQLFDLTLVAVRRELLPNRRLPPVHPLDLRNTKSAALIKYAFYLSAGEFSRLAMILKDVAPSVVYTVRPGNTSAIRRGEKEAIRENLFLVLNGSPTDRRLFG